MCGMVSLQRERVNVSFSIWVDQCCVQVTLGSNGQGTQQRVNTVLQQKGKLRVNRGVQQRVNRGAPVGWEPGHTCGMGWAGPCVGWEPGHIGMQVIRDTTIRFHDTPPLVVTPLLHADSTGLATSSRVWEITFSSAMRALR